MINVKAFYCQSVPRVIFLLSSMEIRGKKHYISPVGIYTGVPMKGNAFCMHFFSRDLFKM